MESRVNNNQGKGQSVLKALYGLESYQKKLSIKQSLLELIYSRVSRINGCANCPDIYSMLHAEDETGQDLHLLDERHEALQEGAALAWTEAVTDVSKNPVPHEVHKEARTHFFEEELTDLTIAVIAINIYNQMITTFPAQAAS